ncbi:DNA polymerase beta superfamily protein [Psychrobacter vallis]|uniref:DNA polymerase beta superfamily protein n=1 Tax=Psychrobacter vallis TaxID=248451 RepID=UPI00191952EA|nr:nucleotidyltransferase domain-containing protein [Psychrobacter vallis]
MQTAPLTIDYLKSEGLILLECLSGSRAYGLETPTSDTDIKGVFYLPKSYYYARHSDYIAQVSNHSNDIVYYELGRYVELLLQNNPNMMELLATPAEHILYKHPLMAHFSADWFISKLCQKTFAGFANSQIKKARGLNKKIVNPMSLEKKSILEFCSVFIEGRSVTLTEWLHNTATAQQHIGLSVMSKATQMYAMHIDNTKTFGFSGLYQHADATQLRLSAIPKGMTPIAYLSFNEQGYSKYCRDYKEYWQWVANRNEARYQSTIAHAKEYDAKNMMHTIRLLEMAYDIATTGKVIVERPNRDELLDIKAGASNYNALLAQADQLSVEIAAAFDSSHLPDQPNEQAALSALVVVRDRLYASID